MACRAGGFAAACGHSSAYVLLISAAQEERARQDPRPRDRADLPHPPRRARDRADLRRAALRCPRASGRLRAAQRLRSRSSGSAAPGRRSRLVAEQSELEHARRVEAVDPEHGARRRGGCAGRHQPDELRADDLRPARRRLRRRSARRSRAARPPPSPRRSCSPGRRPRAGRSSPSARTPGKPPPRLAHDAPRSRARPRRRAAQVDVERDQRPPGADDHAARRRVEPCAARSPARARPRRLAAAAPPARRGGRTPGPRPGELAVEEDRQPELARCRTASSRARRARPLHVPRPDRDDRNDVRGADPRVCALVACAGRSVRARTAIAATSASTSSSSSPTSVKTDRLWSASACTSSSRACSAERPPIASIVVGVAPFGEIRHRLERQHLAYSRSA